MSVNRVLWQSDYLSIVVYSWNFRFCDIFFFEDIETGPYVKNKQWGHKLTLIVAQQNRNRKLKGRMIDVIKSSICLILPSTIFNANNDSNFLDCVTVPNRSLRALLPEIDRTLLELLDLLELCWPKLKNNNDFESSDFKSSTEWDCN